jgi:hypothetical protein
LLHVTADDEKKIEDICHEFESRAIFCENVHQVKFIEVMFGITA